MFVAAARADQPPLSQSYTKMTSDGRYLLVMLDPSRVEEDIRWNPATVAEVKTIHRTYTRSGLYRKGDTSDPLWTVNWYAHGVEAAADGVHMIRVNAWIGSPDVPAVEFYANGKPIRSYTPRELMNDPDRFPRTVSSKLLWYNGGRLDDARLEYAVLTADGNRFVFDIRTGVIVAESRVAQPLKWALWVGVGVVVLAAAAWLVSRWESLRPRTSRV
jgi:hypothetical protein